MACFRILHRALPEATDPTSLLAAFHGSAVDTTNNSNYS